VSKESDEEVVDLIRLVQPKYVFVELDAKRASQLRSSSSNNNTTDSLSTLFKGVGGSQLPPHLMKSLPPQMHNILPMLQRAPDIMKKMGWLGNQGAEMKMAIEEAERVGAKCVYGDVDIDITIQELKLAMMSLASNPINLMQMMNNAPSPPKELSELTNIILTGGNPSQLIEAVKTREQAKQMTKYVSEALPPLYNVMITKRDAHMAKMLRQHCSDGKVVAVVGAGHVEGIEREWQALDNS
jgi:pheromone shutdown protein TraB